MMPNDPPDEKSLEPPNDVPAPRPGRGRPPGSRVADRYLLHDVAGQGGIGLVYRADDELKRNRVALKLIPTGRFSNASTSTDILDEVRKTQLIRHRNVGAVQDCGVHEDDLYIATEWIEGLSLRSWGRRFQHEGVPVAIACRIVLEILDGLDAAHASGVLHLDLKPTNIILTAEPGPSAAPLKILDFGVTALAFENGANAGARPYTAGEMRADFRNKSRATDFYSLSMMFFELLIGVSPPSRDWRPLSDVRPDIPAVIDDLIWRGTSIHPSGRPQNAGDYRRSLMSYYRTA